MPSHASFVKQGLNSQVIEVYDIRVWILLEVTYDPEGNEQKGGQGAMHQLYGTLGLFNNDGGDCNAHLNSCHILFTLAGVVLSSFIR